VVAVVILAVIFLQEAEDCHSQILGVKQIHLHTVALLAIWAVEAQTITKVEEVEVAELAIKTRNIQLPHQVAEWADAVVVKAKPDYLAEVVSVEYFMDMLQELILAAIQKLFNNEEIKTYGKIHK